MKVKQKIAIGYIRFKLKFITAFSKRKAAKEAFRLFCTPYLPKIKKAPAAFKKAEVLSFLFNEKKLRGYRWNHLRATKILIVHGFNSQAYKFGRYALLLVAKGYEVIAFDAPAHGDSEGKTTNAQEYADMIEAVVKEYGPFKGYIAHSFGATALSMAMENIQPDRNTRIVFIAPATETTTTLNSAMELLQVTDEKVKAAIKDIIVQLSGKPVEWFSMKRMMYHINATILWFHDEQDEATPVTDALSIMDDQHPNIEFVITQGLGHRRIYHDHAVRNRIVDFL